MNIKEKIGERIQSEREAKALSRKALAELTDDLNQSRINNYERGDRTPGTQEIKQLAKALDVSPAYLMCLTDDKHSDKPKQIPGLGALLPVLDYHQACDPKSCINKIKNEHNAIKVSFIPITSELAARVGESAFALYMQDDSMVPELKADDLLIVDPDATINPGDLVLAKLKDADKVIIRRYRQLSVAALEEYELLAINNNWPTINSKTSPVSNIIGSIMRFCRDIKMR